MGASLEDQDGFIKHLFHVSQEMKLGKYIMDNPDFIPDVMNAFRGLDESSMMCTKCGQQPCVGGPACGTMGTDEPGPNNPFPADPKNGGYHRPDVNPYNGQEMSEGSGCPCCGDGPCNCESDCEGCDCGSMEEAVAPKYNFAVYDKDGKLKGASSNEKDAKSHAFRIKGEVKKLDKPTTQSDIDQMMAMGEAIGDGFLSGNPSLADLLMKLDEMLDEVTVYRNNHQIDEISITPAQRKADQMSYAILRAKNKIASRTGKSGGKTTVVTDPVSAGDYKAYGKKQKGVKVVADPYKASREESVQETVTNETIAMLRKLAGL
jgi:hypothetical protein